MAQFQVLLRGEHFRLAREGGEGYYGFLKTVYVQSETEDSACEYAVKQAISDPDFRSSVRNAADQELARRRAPRGRALKIERARSRLDGIGKGALVRHATWGDGEVVRVSGDSALTFFPSHGEKLLKLAFLERV